MPGKRISELTALSGAASANNDDLLIFDSGAGETKRISRSQLAEGMVPDLPLQYYLGVLNANPTQRLNGDALQIGDFYLDAVTKYTTVYNGSGWNSYASVIAAQAAAEAARDKAQVARTGAETAATNAETAEAAAVVAQLAAEAAQTAAETAETSAETARDAAFVNADVYADTAAGLAGTTLGDQFQVVSGDEIIRYRHDAGPVATEVARYPAGQTVVALDGALGQLGQLAAILGQAYEEVDRLSAAQEGDAYTLRTLLEALPLIGQLARQINGGQVALRGGSLADPALRIGTAGIYSSAADTLSVAIAGVERLRVTATGITVFGTVTQV